MSREQTIRDVAYAIWEAEGKPEGRDAQHWRMAEERVAASTGPEVGAKAKPPAKVAAKAAPPAKGKAAAGKTSETAAAKPPAKSPAKAASTKAKSAPSEK
jgi:hypothetical protein